MRVWLLSIVVLAAPAFAENPAPIVFAPAGECAGEERELTLDPLPKPAANQSIPPQASLLHVSPAQVAANASAGGPPPPNSSAFAGPGACDNPGSGCVQERVFEDPDPGSGCGLPGSPCP